MKRVLSGVFALALALAATGASAQSKPPLKLGGILDMSSLYADITGAGSEQAAKILSRHLRGGLAARSGDVGVKTGHIEDAAELQRRLALRSCTGGRDCERQAENAGKNPFHESLPWRYRIDERPFIRLGAIMPHAPDSGKPRAECPVMRRDLDRFFRKAE